MSVLITEQDFYDLAWAYLQRAHADNVRHVEMFFDPQGHTVARRRIRDGDRRPAPRHRRCRHANSASSASLIMCFLRHLDEADAREDARFARWPSRTRSSASGSIHPKLGHPPSKFARVFSRARDAGFFLTAHAGEEGPPAYVWEALDVLGVGAHRSRQSFARGCSAGRAARARAHGADRVPALQSAACGSSTISAAHPLRRMMDKGLLVTVNSDDPAYFGGYVNENYRAVSRRAWSCDATRSQRSSATAFEASLMTAAEKAVRSPRSSACSLRRPDDASPRAHAGCVAGLTSGADDLLADDEELRGDRRGDHGGFLAFDLRDADRTDQPVNRCFRQRPFAARSS